jgi:hypothetical protein
MVAEFLLREKYFSESKSAMIKNECKRATAC